MSSGLAAPVPLERLADDRSSAEPVDVELVLATDVSYSMDLDELAVQREGYADAIISPEFLQALKSGRRGKVAVTYFEWAASNDQKLVIPWRLIDGPESAGADPGPACYGRSLLPTVTDAHVVLGHFGGGGLLGGEFKLDERRAQQALAPLTRTAPGPCPRGPPPRSSNRSAQPERRATTRCPRTRPRR